KDPNPVTSSMAQKAFLEFGESAIVPLISGLYEPDPDVRQVSENALIRIGEPIVPHLIQEIPFHKEQDREPLISVIIRIGEPAIPHLIQALATGQGEIPRAVIQILPRMGAITIPYLLSSVKEQEKTSSLEEVFLSMGRIAFPFLEEASERESGKTALFAINIIRKIDPVRAVEPLTVALYHPDQSVRETALENLVEIGEMAIPRLVQVLGSGNEEAVELARMALVRNGDAAVPHLVDALGDPMGGDQEMILDILRKAGTDALLYLIPAMATTKEGHEEAMMLVRETGSRAAPYLLEAFPAATPDLAHPIKTLLQECYVQDPGGFIFQIFSGHNLDTDFIFELISSSPGMVIPHLIGVVQGDDEKKALAAGDLLARFGTDAMDPLMNLLRRESDEDRKLVITSFLIKIGPDAIPALISAMTEPNLAPYAMAALGAIGEPAIPSLLPLLKSHDNQVLQYAILALTRIGSPAASALMALMQEDESLVPLISRILAEMGGAALPELLSEMQSLKEQGQEGSNRGIVLMSMITEIALSGREDMQYLFRIEDPILRGMLERVFIIKGEVILNPVINAVLDEQSVPEMAATIFTSFRPQTLSAATKMIKELPEGDTRKVPLLQILGLLRDPASASLIYESLHDENHEIRLTAVRQLGKFGREALEPLTEAMNDPDTRVRAAAVDSLGHIGLPVLDQLITALKDRDGTIRTAAINGIAKIGEPGQFMLIQSLDDKDRQVRQAVARLLDQSNWKPKYTTDKISYLFAREDFDSLVRIGPPSLDILAKGLQDADPGIKEKSREALESIRSSIQSELKKQ
ncbi:MAG: HEAT repeat domain-containing protein, partial [Methanospirillum sp.]|nr:HEAT repeat domain-containing protein [Methanospirillum sp.]